jgi:DNA-directed RNA polymerase specialized sigma subunit
VSRGRRPLEVVALDHDPVRRLLLTALVFGEAERANAVLWFPVESRVADIESKLLEIGIPAEDIDRALESLPERERKLIELTCGLKGNEPWSCEELGRHFGISAIKIQQIENQALEKLRLLVILRKM